MNIVQPGSATVNVKGVVVRPAITRAARRSPGTGLATSTGTSATPCRGCRGCPAVVRPSPSTRTGSKCSRKVTRTNCSGASDGPANSSVDSAEMTCTPNTLRARSCEHPLVTAHENRKSTLTVMTLNLWGANRWEDRRSAVVDWVNEVQPDLLALQEVVRAGGHCQASWIAAHTQMTALFGAAGTRDGGEFGNAVLRRLPMRGSHRHRLSDAATGNEPRALTAGEAEAFGRSVWFSSTHLSWRFDEGWVRERQVRDIVDIVGPHPHDL